MENKMNDRGIGISVVVPVYNVKPWLADCLDSLLAQTVPFNKIIAIDDCSTDGSGLICDDYAEINPNIVVFHQDVNSGLGVARNVGVSFVDSEYVMFVDSDDMLCDTAVEMLLTELKEKRYDSLYYDFENFFDEGLEAFSGEIKCDRRIKSKLSCFSGEDFFSAFFPDSYIVTGCSNVYRTELIREIQFPEHLLYEDNYTYFVNMVSSSYVGYVPLKLYLRRYRKDSITTSDLSRKAVVDYCKCVNMIYDFIFHNQKILNKVENEKIIKFILMYLDITLSMYKTINRQGLSDSIIKKDVQKVWESNVQILRKIGMSNMTLSEMVRIYRVCQKLLYNNFQSPFTNEECKIISEKSQECYIKKLEKLHLNNSSKKYGIYGVGKHTEGLLKAYNDLIGEITADILFYVTETDGNDTFLGYKINPISDIKTDLDGVIVSSYIYGKEMTEKIKHIFNESQIITFYEDLDMDLFSEYKKEVIKKCF